MLASTGSVHAQPFPSATQAADLRRHLETLSQNPNSAQALIDAGRAALDMGDGAAALGFFTRASQVAPGNPRVKLGLAAAQVRSGRPQNAIMLFMQAQAMGVPLSEFAGERGLAYDLMGQPAAAQQDYVAALRYREDPEVRRRLALSLAITGQKDAALRVIGDQVRRGDRSAMRTRAFVLALSGDAAGATEAARTSMPPGAAQAIAPFFQRLGGLSAGQMASAAHLGRFPANAGYRSAAAGRLPSYPGALAFAGGGAPAPNIALAARLPVAVPAANVSRRRSESGDGNDRSSRLSARERRSLAAASSRPRASDEARRTVDRWNSGRTQSAAARAPAAIPPAVQQFAGRVASAPPSLQTQNALAAASPVNAPAMAAPAPTLSAPAPAAVAQSIASAVPLPLATSPQSTITSTATAPLLMPHPHQPLRSAAASGTPAPGLSPDLPSGSGPTLLAEAAAFRIPESAPPASAPQPTIAPPVEPSVVPPSAAPAVATPPAQPAATEANQATASLAVLSSGSSLLAAPPTETQAAPSPAASSNTTAPSAQSAPPAAEPARPAFAEVAAAITALPLETGAAPERPAETRRAPAARQDTTSPRPARSAEVRGADRAPGAATDRAAGNSARGGTRTASAEGARGADNATRAGGRNSASASARGSAEAARPAVARTQARTPQQANPTRIWVQLASAARASLPGELNRLRRIAPELLRSRNGYTSPLSSSNDRLLVGPFATAAEARAFVNQLKEENISAYAWTSDGGQEVERLPAGR